MKTSILKSVLALLFVISLIPVTAQVKKLNVSGKVINAQSKNPIAGVQVNVKGTSISVSTDQNGYYRIQLEPSKVLRFSRSGFTAKEVRIEKSVVLNVSLQAVLASNTKQTQVEKTKKARTDLAVPPAPMIMECKEEVLSMDMSAVSAVAYYAPVSKMYIAPEQSQEEYKAIAENRFKDPKTEALSTFSLDVDAASYSNVRRVINAGQMPDKNSVRVEEMINYFSYNYPQPKDNHPVNISTEVHSCPWNQKHLLVRIGVKAKEIPSDNLPASNFVFLLDVSGSMASPNKLDLVKSSLKLLCNNLRAKDRVAIVVYAGAAGVVLESTPGDDKQKIVESFERLNAGGSTAGGAGIELAYKIAQKNFIAGGNNRIILCTDGDFNVGVSSELGLEQLIEAKRKTGIFLTVLGYGMGNYKDNKLQVLAQKGNGNHAYIDNIQEANKVLVNEFGSTMYAVAKDVKLQVEFNPAYVQSYRLVGYESRLLNKEDFNDDTKDAGELGAGHTVTAFYEIIPVGVLNTFGGVDELRYQSEERTGPAPELPKALVGNEMMYVKLRYKPIGSDVSLKMEVPISIKNERVVPSDDYLFAAAVAMFAQQLRESDFKGDGSYAKVISLANRALGDDKNGYRREFVRLVEAVNQLAR